MTGLLFFESHSLWLTMCAYRRIRRATRVVFLDPFGSAAQVFVSPMRLDRALLRVFGWTVEDAVERLASRLNPHARVERTPIEEILPILYRLNRECLEDIDRLDEVLAASAPFQALSAVVGGESDLLKYYKNVLALALPRRRLFSALAKQFEQGVERVELVPDNPSDDVLTVWSRESIRRRSSRLDGIRQALRSAKVRLFQVLVGPSLALYHLRNGWGRATRGHYKVAVPVLWGVFGTEDQQTEGVRRYSNDEYLYGPGLEPGDILHTLGTWQKSAADESRFTAAMAAKGYPYVDSRRYKLNHEFLKVLLKAQMRIFGDLVRPRSWRAGDLALQSANLKGYHHFFKKWLELCNVSCAVEYVKNDYNPAHVINTIVCHQRNRRVVATAHAGSSYDAPQLAFVHFDRYVALCETYVRTFLPYWDRINLVRAGRESLDWLFPQLGDGDRIRQRIEGLYGRRLHIVTVLLPGPGATSVAARWRELQRGFEMLAEENCDCRILLRFRNEKHMSHPKARGIASLPLTDPRVVIDHRNFTTHELISASDLVIASNASFGVNEAVVAGKRVFTFGFTLKEHLYFPPETYGRDFVMTRAEDLVKVFRSLAVGFTGLDYNWNQLVKDVDYYHDGRNCERLRQNILSLIGEMSGPSTDARPLCSNNKWMRQA